MIIRMSKSLVLLGIICGLFASINANGYYGSRIGSLSTLMHGVSGEIYAVDSRTLFIKNFNYDGQGPAAQFLVGTSNNIGKDGSFVLRDERGTTNPLPRYRNKDITLTLPEGKTLRDIRWFSVWCYEFSVDFGNIRIPQNLDFPKPQKIAALKGVHGVSSDPIVIVDAQTILVPNFSYDGEAPDAKFWAGHGARPTPNGILIPDENGREQPLMRYDKKTIVLTLPGDLTIFDIGHFGVWCVAFTVDFGHVLIPEGVNVPPSLKMLGISPQSKLNCEVLYDDLAFEVRWAVAGESIVVQLVAKLDNNEYMSFGVSPDKSHSVMIGADVVVAWVDSETGKGYAQDYYLDAKSQCSGKRGSCPDTRLLDNSNSIRLLNAAMVNGYSIVTYQRPLKASDRFDLPITLNGTQAIVWAIGPLNQRLEVSFHSHYTHGDRFIDFGRPAIWNCPLPDGEMHLTNNNDEDDEEIYDKQYGKDTVRYSHDEDNHRPQKTENRRQQQQQQQQINRRGSQTHEQQNHHNGNSELSHPRRPIPTPKPASRNGAWDIPPIQCYEPDDGVFYAQMGPTGGKQGYPAITGHVGWGISWYINGLLIPEINVVRGKTYTFVVEGGNDPEIPAKYHPFYITDDSVGGYEYKTEEEKENINIYAGVHRSRTGSVVPIGVGRLCNWTPDTSGPFADEYKSFGAYQRTLTLKCDEGEPGIITWRPDENTPDTVYYQCFTHRYLGWKINVLDYCDNAQASNREEVFTEPLNDDDGFESEASIRHETKIKPNEIFLLQHEKDLIKNHNMNEQPPRIQFDLNKGSEITKIIADGIKAAEALEESISNSRKNLSYTYTHGTTNPTIKETSLNVEQNNSHFIEKPPNTSGVLGFKRPPNLPPNTMHRPIKPLTGRRPPPTYVDRRRPNFPQRPHPVAQPSLIVNNYKKPVPPIMRPFLKPSKPIKSIASVLVLGQQNDIGPSRKTFEQKLHKPSFKTNTKVPLKMPVRDVKKPPTSPTHSLKESLANRKKPLREQPIKEKPILKNTFKNPYEITKDRLIPALQIQNTGFKPDSVVVEGGFRPIIRRRNEDLDDLDEDDDTDEDDSNENQNRRKDDNISDFDEIFEGDALFINQEVQSKTFEPMFIPSPPDSLNTTYNYGHKEKLTGDLQDMEIEVGDDKLPMAGERVDAYYLPPDTRKKENQNYPDGAVVTYDGKTVLDTSLANIFPPPLPQSMKKSKLANSGHLSRSEELVRNSPQFGPFTGEIPPPIPEFISSDNTPQLSATGNSTKQSQVPVTEYTSPIQTNTNPISTKLTLLSPHRNKRNGDTLNINK